MSITDELRQVAAKTETASGRCERLYRGDLERIADRIDAEVADMQSFCDRLRDAAERREDVTLFGVDYVALPVDADGTPIHVGDEVESVTHGGVGVVSRIQYWVDANGDMRAWVMVKLYGTGAVWEHRPCMVRHYTPPTVEDVLRAMCIEIDRRCESGGIDYDKLFAEYAAKLRLAGEDE